MKPDFVHDENNKLQAQQDCAEVVAGEEWAKATRNSEGELKFIRSLKNILIHEKGPQQGPHQWVNSGVTFNVNFCCSTFHKP